MRIQNVTKSRGKMGLSDGMRLTPQIRLPRRPTASFRSCRSSRRRSTWAAGRASSTRGTRRRTCRRGSGTCPPQRSPRRPTQGSLLKFHSVYWTLWHYWRMQKCHSNRLLMVNIQRTIPLRNGCDPSQTVTVPTMIIRHCDCLCKQSLGQIATLFLAYFNYRLMWLFCPDHVIVAISDKFCLWQALQRGFFE